MKKTILLITILTLFTNYSFAFQKSNTLSNCQITNEQNHDIINDDIRACIDKELERDTKQNYQNSHIFNFIDSEQTNETINFWFKNMSYVFAISIFAYFFSRFNSTIQLSDKEKSDKFVSFFMYSLILSVLLDSSFRKFAFEELGKFMAKDTFAVLNAMNYYKNNSANVNVNIVNDNKIQIEEKTEELTNYIIDQNICALNFYQEQISTVNSQNIEILKSNELINCITDFENDNKDNSIKENGNMLLIPAAIKYCSQEHSSKIVDCGNLYTNSDITELNNLVNDFSFEVEETIYDYTGYICDNEENVKKSPYCNTIKNNVAYTFTTNKSYFDVKDELSYKKEDFKNQLKKILINNIDVNNNVYDVSLTDILGQIKSFLSINKTVYDGTNTVISILSAINYSNVVIRDISTGRYIDEIYDNNDEGSEEVKFFYFSIKQDLKTILDKNESIIESIVEDNDILNDPKKFIFGEKITINFFENVNSSYEMYLNILIPLKIATVYKTKQNPNSKLYDSLDSIINFLLYIIHSGIIFTYLILLVFLLYIIIQAFKNITSFIIKICLFVISKKRPETLIEDLFDFKLKMITIPFVFILSLVFTSLFLIMSFSLIELIPFSNNYIVKLFIVLTLFLICNFLPFALLIHTYKNLTAMFKIKGIDKNANVISTFKKVNRIIK